MGIFRKRKRQTIVLSLILGMNLLAAGCACTHQNNSAGTASQSVQNDSEKMLLGSWAFIHEPDETVAVFSENGTLVYEGKKYTYTADESFISFLDNGKEVMRLRYLKNGDEQMYLYIQSTYKLQSEKKEGIIGLWKSKENWTFEFTIKGTFMEDGVLTGHYYVNEEEGTIKLVYEKALDDSSLYYKLTEDGLFIEYPWLMVKKES